MASFDRKPVGGANNGSSKKNLIAGLLAVVLVVVVVHQFVKAKPSDAAPSDAPAAQAAEVTPETLDSASRGLDDNPLKGNTLLAVEPPSALDRSPSDPFQLSDAWRIRLTKPADAVVVTVEVQTPHADNPAVKAYDASGLKLTGIFRTNNRSYAIINGKILNENNTIQGAKIVEIGDDRVVLQPLNGSGSERVELVIKPKI